MKDTQLIRNPVSAVTLPENNKYFNPLFRNGVYKTCNNLLGPGRSAMSGKVCSIQSGHVPGYEACGKVQFR